MGVRFPPRAYPPLVLIEQEVFLLAVFSLVFALIILLKAQSGLERKGARLLRDQRDSKKSGSALVSPDKQITFDK
ncbi:hypothetical protein B5V91_04490 [Heyndrickxia sporothermodurans]|nr:hypothetical protein B5V91_04490 [Heyndrickxia sporothermodurans]